MAETTSKEFDLPKTSTFIRFPLAFTGEDKQFKGLTDAYQFLLTEIYTMNKAVKAPAKLTYDHFVEKFGMSRDTVCDGLRVLEERKIIEKRGRSRYEIIVKFKERDYVIIKDYLLKKLWNVNGVLKRLARSRIVTLAFLERENSNPKTSGVFDSSQERICKIINKSKSTAGDCVRELAAIGVINLQKLDTHVEAYKRGLTRYTVAPEVLAVKACKPEPPPDEDLQEVKEIFKQHDKKVQRRQNILEQWQAINEQIEAEEKVEPLQQRLLEDDTYKNLFERLQEQKSYHMSAICLHIKSSEEEAERELQAIGEEIKAYLKAHDVPLDSFPKGYFYIF